MPYCGLFPSVRRQERHFMKKILYINQEIAPYLPETEMSLLGRDLPQQMQEQGNEIRTFMPKWGTINERRGQLHEVIRLSGMNLIVNDTDHPLIIKVASIPTSRLQVYFIDNDEYFAKQRGQAVPDIADNVDNGERAIFFARGVLETVKKLRWTPDIIHCNGWMAAIVPYYLKTAYKDEPAFANAKVVTTLFEDGLKEEVGSNFINLIDFKGGKKKALDAYQQPFDGKLLERLAIDFSDAIVCTGKTASSQQGKYAKATGKPLLKSGNADLAENLASFYETI